MPFSDGGSPIAHYVVERRLKGTLDWTDRTECPDTTFRVTGLREGEEYVFRVSAVNEAGHESDPSKTSQEMKAEEAVRKLPKFDMLYLSLYSVLCILLSSSWSLIVFRGNHYSFKLVIVGK